MKMDENQKKNNSKITPFPSQKEREEDKEFDALFKERLLSDADEYEKELNENPDLADVKAPDDLFDRIVGELKEKSIWEEEEDERKLCNGDVDWEDNQVGLTREEIYNLLTDDDRAALELGKKMQGRKKWKRVVKYGGTVAAIFVGVFLISMMNEANRDRAIGVINNIFDSNLSVKISNGNREIIKTDIDGLDACSVIKEQLGIQVPILQYIPNGMKYHDYQIDKYEESASISYKIGESILTIFVCKATKGHVENIIFEGEIASKEIIEVNKNNIEIWNLKNSDNSNAYVAKFQYDNNYCSIWAKMDKPEFIKMVENLYF